MTIGDVLIMLAVLVVLASFVVVFGNPLMGIAMFIMGAGTIRMVNSVS